MTATIACSVCHAILSPGATVCPGCGLPLMAQALRVTQPPRPPLIPGWLLAVGAIALLLSGLGVLSSYQGSRNEAARAALLQDFASGALSTQAAFEARCGAARSVQQGKDGAELVYIAAGTDYFVTLAGTAPRIEIDQVRTDRKSKNGFSSYRIAQNPAIALASIGCK